MKEKLNGYTIKGIFKQKNNWYAQLHNDKDELMISATLDYIIDNMGRYLPAIDQKQTEEGR